MFPGRGQVTWRDWYSQEKVNPSPIVGANTDAPRAPQPHQRPHPRRRSAPPARAPRLHHRGDAARPVLPARLLIRVLLHRGVRHGVPRRRRLLPARAQHDGDVHRDRPCRQRRRAHHPLEGRVQSEPEAGGGDDPGCEDAAGRA